MPLLFPRQRLRNAVPLFGMTGAHMYTHPKLDSESGPAQCRCRSVVYVATVCQSSCHIAECWNPFNSAACRPSTHKVHLHTFELGDCRWTAAVTGLVAAPPPFFMICFMETSSDADAAWFATFQTCHLRLLFRWTAEMMYSLKWGYSLCLCIF